MGGSEGRESRHAAKIKQPTWAIQLVGEGYVWLCLSFPSSLRQEGPPEQGAGPLLAFPVVLPQCW